MELTQKQENFTQNLFKGMSQREAYIQAGYSAKSSPAILDIRACELAKNSNIVVRREELRQKVEDASVATVLERKQILTEIARGNLLDYQEVGADGSYLNIDKEKPNSRAISEITSRTEYDKDGANAAIITKVKLHSPAQAIDLLNKMEKLYSDVSQGNSENKFLVFILSDPKLIDGIGKRLNASIKGDDAIE